MTEKPDDDAAGLYERARAAARAGEGDAAIEHLQRAFELDRGVRQRAQTETDFDFIRGRPEFPHAYG